MFFSVKDAYNRMRLNLTLRGVLQIAPAQLSQQSTFGLLSQIREKDLLMYLLAVKSFCRWHQPARVTLLTDGRFSESGIRILREHVPGITVEAHVKYRNTNCPIGGTWERLLGLVTHAADMFTIQLDADTVTRARLEAVASCILHGRAFTLGSLQGQRLCPAVQASQRAKDSIAKGDHHVQVLSESKLDQFMPEQAIKYVRGCSGFTGIGPSATTVDVVAQWARVLGRLVGSRWREWGTEQFMSNLVIANIEGSVVLPHPAYATCPNISEEGTVFAHMAGFCRFSHNHQYARFASSALSFPG